MTSVVQMTKVLDERPEVRPLAAARVRHYVGETDIDAWLALRQRAFARQRVAVRAWLRDDFCRELLQRPWWSPDRMWLAEWIDAGEAPRLAGAVTLAERGAGRPAVHWLMVDPRARRRGIGRLLMALLEQRCWDQGARQIWLETHRQWQGALALYEGLGYRECAP